MVKVEVEFHAAKITDLAKAVKVSKSLIQFAARWVPVIIGITLMNFLKLGHHYKDTYDSSIRLFLDKALQWTEQDVNKYALGLKFEHLFRSVIHCFGMKALW